MHLDALHCIELHCIATPKDHLKSTKSSKTTVARQKGTSRSPMSAINGLFGDAALDDGKTLPEDGRDDKQTNCFQSWI